MLDARQVYSRSSSRCKFRISTRGMWWVSVGFEREIAVMDKFTLALVDLNLDASLEVGSRREDLALLGRDGSVAVD